MGMNQREALYRQFEDRGGILNQWYPYSNPPASAWTPYDKRVVATQGSGAAVTLTTSLGTDPTNGPPVNTMDIAASAGGSDNHREFFLRSDRNYEYSQITSWIYGGGTWADADNRTQQGHVHRYQRMDNGHIRAYVAWHDMFIGIPTALNLGIWELDGTGIGSFNLHSVNAILPLNAVPPVPVQICSRATNVITCWVSGAHYFRVGDKVNLTVRDATNITNATVTTVAFGNFIQIAHVGADDTDMGSGIIYRSPTSNPLASFPYTLSSRLLPGDIFQAKIWRPWEQEPPWSAAVTYATPNPTDPATGNPVGVPPNDRWPRGQGLCGIYAGHLHNSELVRFGLPDIRELSA